MEDEKGKSYDEKTCGLLAIQGQLMAVNERLVGIQQATEGNRNVGAEVGDALVGTFQKGFNKLAKAQLIKDRPELAILDD
jgi:hypothetical protein